GSVAIAAQAPLGDSSEGPGLQTDEQKVRAVLDDAVDNGYCGLQSCGASYAQLNSTNKYNQIPYDDWVAKQEKQYRYFVEMAKGDRALVPEFTTMDIAALASGPLRGAKPLLEALGAATEGAEEFTTIYRAVGQRE